MKNASECNSIYSNKKWSEFIQSVYHYKIFDLKDGSNAVSLAKVNSKIFSNRLISLPFADYGNINVKGDASTLTNAIIECAIKEKVNYVEIRTPSDSVGVLLEKSGFEKRNDYVTFKLDITNPALVLKKMEKRTRNDITKSQKAGFELCVVEKEADIEAFYKIYTSTMKNLGSPPQSLKFFKKMKKILGENCEIYLAKLKGKPIAGAVFLPYENEVHYAYSCYLKEHAALRGVEFLIWDAIVNFSEQGFEKFDFGRTRYNSGVFTYKKGWGGIETQMPYYYYFLKEKIEQRDEIKYKKLSQIWAKVLPLPIANTIGPWLIKQIG